MKTLHLGLFTLLVLAVLGGNICMAQLPLSVNDNLSARQQTLSHSSFEWHLSNDRTDVGIVLSKHSVLVRQVADLARAETTKDGMSGEAADKFVQNRVQWFIEFCRGFTIHQNADWQFQVDGTATRVIGENQTSQDAIPKFVHYYYQRYGVAGTPSARLVKTNETAGPQSVEVWKTLGDATMYRTPIGGMDINPEDFALLVGKNPLQMYGTQWALISTATNAYVLEANILTGAGAPFALTLTLDRQHDNAPSRISFERSKGMGAQWTESYVVNQFKKQQGVWFPADVTMSYDRPRYTKYTRHWTLRSVATSKPVILTMPNQQDLTDYRLLGANLSAVQLEQETQLKPYDVIAYQWGPIGRKLPTEAELRQLRAKFHPGEGTPDATSSSNSAFGVGGLMIFASGLWSLLRKRLTV